MKQTSATRRADVDDVADIARLLDDFNREFGVPSPGVDVLRERLLRLLGGDSMLAIVSGRPPVAVALVSVRPNVWYEGDVAMLEELYVEPERRNDGIGSAVVDHLHRLARAAGWGAVEINVDEGDVDAQRFYERHGYTAIEPDSSERAFYYFREFAD